MFLQTNKSHFRDQAFGRLLLGFTFVVVILLLLIIVFLINEAAPALSINNLKAFFATDDWYPLEGLFGLLPMVIASFSITVLAVCLALPLGVACALFICCYASPTIASFYRHLLNLLAGIPSVIYGLWGLTVLVPIFAEWHAPGASLIVAAIILALMILPTISLTTVASINNVPEHQHASATVLALSKKTKLKAVVFPYAKQGIISGTLLALTRALGETMAVLMVSGNIVQIPSSIFDPVRALTSNIALEMAYATGLHRSSLFVTGLLLTISVIALVALSHRFSRISQHV